MMCQPGLSRQYVHGAEYNCGCCECGPSFRTFLTTEEKLEHLKNYEKQLDKELAGVQERIGELNRE